jgi:hypothetical protein
MSSRGGCFSMSFAPGASDGEEVMVVSGPRVAAGLSSGVGLAMMCYVVYIDMRKDKLT